MIKTLLAASLLILSGSPPTATRGTQAFSDGFTGINGSALPAGWTVVNGTWTIDANQGEPGTLGFAANTAVWGTNTDSVNQYAKVTLSTATGDFACIVFRYTNSSSPLYTISFDISNDKINWVWQADAADSSDTTVDSTGGNGSFTVSNGDIYGVTCEGTGTATTIRIWKTPPTNTPTSASNWGGDTTPDITFTADPATPVNTGNKVGIAAFISTAHVVRFDDFFAGDTP